MLLLTSIAPNGTNTGFCLLSTNTGSYTLCRQSPEPSQKLPYFKLVQKRFILTKSRLLESGLRLAMHVVDMPLSDEGSWLRISEFNEEKNEVTIVPIYIPFGQLIVRHNCEHT